MSIATKSLKSRQLQLCDKIIEVPYAATVCGNPETGQFTGDNSKSPTGRSITAEQFQHRMILRQAMLRHGFKPLDSEWWHFTLRDEPFPDTYFTFPVKML